MENEDFEPIIPSEHHLFDWEQFHKDLDRALAAYLEDGGSIHDEIVEFGKYSNYRRMPENQGEPEE